MNNPFIPLLIIGLLLSTGFGLVAMSMDEQGHGDCPFQAAGMTGCSFVQSPFNFIISHFNAISGFFSAVPVKNFLISLAGLSGQGQALALSLLFILVFLIRFGEETGSPGMQSIPVSEQSRAHFVPPNKILFTRWLSLQENSPSFAIRRW